MMTLEAVLRSASLTAPVIADAGHKPSAFAIFSWNLNAPLEPSYFHLHLADNSAPKFDRRRAPCQLAGGRAIKRHCRIVAA